MIKEEIERSSLAVNSPIMQFKSIFLFLAIFFTGIITVQGQTLSDFEKLVKKNTRKADKSSVRKKIESAYQEIQITHINELTRTFDNPEYPPKQSSLNAAVGYSKAKLLFKNLYGTTTVLDGENKMLQVAGLKLGSYYSAGVEMTQKVGKSNQMIALANFKFVEALDPSYKEVSQLMKKLSDEISYNVLIRYNLEGFEELEQTMFELNNVLINEIKGFGSDKVNYVFETKADPKMDFQYTVTLDFEFLQVPLVSSRIDQKTYHKNQGKIAIKAQVDKEVFERNIMASGNAIISSTVFNVSFNTEPFNIKIRTKTYNSKISGDNNAIDSINLRRISQEKSSQSNHQKISDEQFRESLFNIIRRQIQEIESYI